MKNKKKGFYNKISTKMLAVVVVAMVVSLAGMTVVAKNFSQNRLLESQTNNLRNLAVSKSISLEQYVSDQKTIASLVKINSAVVEQAVVYSKIGVINPIAQINIAESLKSLYTTTGQIYENLFVTVGAEGFADCLGNKTLHNVADEPFYKECMEKGYFFGNNVSPVTGRPVYVIAYAVENPETGERVGSVNMSIDMESLGRDVVQDEVYDVTILDRNGVVIATNGDTSSILTDLGQVDPEGIREMIANGTGWKEVDLSMWGGPVTVLSYYVSDNFITEVSVDKSEVHAPADEMARNLTILAFMLGIIAFAVAGFVLYRVLKPADTASKQIQQVIADINDGHGDLTQKLSLRSRDEIGDLVMGINDLMETLGSVISKVQVTTNEIRTGSNEITEQVKKAEMEINNVSSTMEEMSAASEETSASLNQVMQQVDNVADLVTEVNRRSVEQAEYANEVAAKVVGLKEKAARDNEAASKTLDEVASKLRTKISNAKQVQEIANLTDEILNITSQTNLLSLNASIEAARAGEAGRGFAVVADEIRQLADSSAEAANRIQSVTNSVIAAVEELAAEAEKVTQYMVKTNETSHAESDALTESYSSDILQLSSLMKTFKENSEEIQLSMSTIREAVNIVDVGAGETAQGITNVAHAAVELSNELDEVVNQATKANEETSELAAELDKFKV